MDLRSIINTDGADSSAHKHAPTPVSSSKAALPRQGFRDFSHPPPPPPPPPPSQASPYRHPSHDLGPIPYSSPTTFQGAYHTRAAPPLQLQPPSQSDLRSPATSSHSIQSPYRQTPTSSFSGQQYPFPQNQPPPSPKHQILLQQQQQQQHQRESFSQTANNSPRLQNQSVYDQSFSGVSQSSPIGTPGGGSFPYPPQHQRSQSSSYSTPTPTSAQSQPQFYSHQTHESPVSTVHPQSAVPHQSQPGTPLGPPVSIPRQSSSAYSQPQSPYSQRGVSIGGFPPQYPNIQTSPAPRPPPQLTRMPGTPTTFESHRSSTSDTTRQSHSERERSLSVSPKTRLPTKILASISHTPDQEMERGRGVKREREDSDSSQPTTINGHKSMEVNTITATSPSPVQRPQKRTRYMEPPIWAQSYKRVRGKEASPLGNKRPPSSQANGKVVSRPPTNAISQKQSPLPPSRQVPSAQVSGKVKACLSPWEPSILGVQPMEESSKIIADWLFLEVVNRPDMNELASHGIQIEIEAKLGQLIDRSTQSRLALPTQTECVLTPDGHGIAGTRTIDWTFLSSMTEGQHKTMNDFLNEQAKESYTADPPRVNVQYKHRRERDVFYELPRQARKSLPSIIQAHSNPNHAMKVRVTHDEKTGEELAKIIKTRVADLDLYLPRQAVDCRISINLEMTYQGHIRELEEISKAQRSPDRFKDRLSYTHSHYQFDLTQVTMSDGMQRPTKEHELEIELSTVALMEQGRCAMANPPREHMYPELVQGFLDNIRVLTRNVPAP